MVTNARKIPALKVYLEPRVAAMLLLGFSSGLPLALTGTTLQIWMSDAGVSLSAIGLFSLVALPYTVKFLWAPLVDAIPVPYLSRRLGRRRGWVVASQLGLIAAIIAMGRTDPVHMPMLLAVLALGVAFLSATQDIVIDAFRVEALEARQQAAGMANFVAAYRVAMLVSTAGAIELFAWLQSRGLDSSSGWGITYLALAMLLLGGIAAILWSPEPGGSDRQSAPNAGVIDICDISDVHQRPDVPDSSDVADRLRQAVIGPFADFARRPGWVLILAFIVLFKFGDAVAGVMTAPFVLDIGFEMTTYGRVVKGVGLIAVLAGGFVGGYAVRAIGVLPSLWIAGIVQMLSNLMFYWLAEVGAQLPLLVMAISTENLAGGFGTVIFVAYISGLCRERAYTATQFALLTSLAAVGRTGLAAGSGYLAATMGWSLFFLISVIAALPGLMLLYWIMRYQTEQTGWQADAATN